MGVITILNTASMRRSDVAALEMNLETYHVYILCRIERATSPDHVITIDSSIINCGLKVCTSSPQVRSKLGVLVL